MSKPENQVVVRKDSEVFIEIDVAKRYSTGGGGNFGFDGLLIIQP